jgi:polyisoprenoid-binding protein YceI
MKSPFPFAVAAILSALCASTVQAAPYTIDPAHTYPSLEMNHMGISVWRGKFEKSRGTVEFDAKAQKGSVNIIIDTASINWGMPQMNEFSKATDWLNAGEHPAATYKGNLTFKDGKPAGVEGQLTLRGVTKPVALTIKHFGCLPHPVLKREVCGADAEATVNRVDFGMDKYAAPDNVKITLKIQVEAIRDE